MAAKQTTRELRRRNRSALLSRLYLQGRGSRLELVDQSGLSSSTVSNVISDLIADGVVEEAGSAESEGGRPRTVLQIRRDYGHVIGVDIGETHIEVGLFDCTLNTVATATYPIAGNLDPTHVAELILAGIAEVSANPVSVMGIGVGVPGAVESDGLVHAPTFGWQGVPLAKMLADSVSAPLYVDNCARTLGQAEMWRGAGRGATRAVIALLGVGVGAAMAVESDSQEGVSSSTTEWGHTVVHAGGLACRCGSRGCLEAYIGAEGILDRYLALAGSEPFTATDTESRMRELADRAELGGPAADTLASTAEYLGIGIANLTNLVTPDCVVLSGWVSLSIGHTILDAVRESARRHSLAYLRDRTRIELGQLGPEAVALGAATLPVVRFLTNGG
ncbi:ROK family protein [Kutzneria buriramensis]|uniref:Putative NBD/HSP70 family sugar kinase n=1 Tax=Kutzneria buriramensis TaxID=1045776 RepID=A0A3E0IAJ6_9PSEU|nr:ROK family protein [Kutzneria buriramensis]REH55165.1 putative NBD/HSP70 family sugar kinase [Kutzneria buriramensis]